LNQQHWSIENRLRLSARRDSWGRCPAWVRIKEAPQTLAALNGGVLATSGLVGRDQWRFPDAPFLCPASRSSSLVARQAFRVIPVYRKALALKQKHLTPRVEHESSHRLEVWRAAPDSQYWAAVN
jgi:hypothetical protein